MVARATVSSVLIVDAEPYICRVFAAKLTKDNQFMVSTASNGVDAFHAAQQRPYNVILWDMRLRETTSILPSLRALCPNASLILSTTDDRPNLNSQIQSLDVSDILVKPFGLDTFADRIRDAINRQIDLMPGHSAHMDVARIGQQITIETASGQFQTRVLDGDQDIFSIVGKPRVDTPASFEPGLTVKVYIMAEDGVYSFRSRLLRKRSDHITVWDLSMPRTIHRSQRRKGPRLPLKFPVTIHIPSSSSTQQFNSAVFASAELSNTTSDLSMGGFAIVSNEPIPVGASLEFDILASGSAVTGSCRVMRSNPWLMDYSYSGDHNLRYKNVLRFESLGSDSRELLKTLISPSQDSADSGF